MVDDYVLSLPAGLISLRPAQYVLAIASVL